MRRILIDKIIKWRGNVLAVMGRNRGAEEQNNGSIEIKRQRLLKGYARGAHAS